LGIQILPLDHININEMFMEGERMDQGKRSKINKKRKKGKYKREKNNIIKKEEMKGSAIAQAISRWLPNAAARVQTRV
jgi:hypothetical protein